MVPMVAVPPLTPALHLPLPDIREHALFALRNLLVGNPASQELVAQLKPLTPEEAAASASA